MGEGKAEKVKREGREGRKEEWGWRKLGSGAKVGGRMGF